MWLILRFICERARRKCLPNCLLQKGDWYSTPFHPHSPTHTQLRHLNPPPSDVTFRQSKANDTPHILWTYCVHLIYVNSTVRERIFIMCVRVCFHVIYTHASTHTFAAHMWYSLMRLLEHKLYSNALRGAPAINFAAYAPKRTRRRRIYIRRARATLEPKHNWDIHTRTRSLVHAHAHARAARDGIDRLRLNSLHSPSERVYAPRVGAGWKFAVA